MFDSYLEELKKTTSRAPRNHTSSSSSSPTSSGKSSTHLEFKLLKQERGDMINSQISVKLQDEPENEKKKPDVVVNEEEEDKDDDLDLDERVVESSQVKSEPIEVATDSNGVMTSSSDDEDKDTFDPHLTSSRYPPPARLTPTHRSSRDSLDQKIINNNKINSDYQSTINPSPPVRRISSTINPNLTSYNNQSSKIVQPFESSSSSLSSQKIAIGIVLSNRFKLLVALLAILVFVMANNFYFAKRVQLDTPQSDSQENTTMLSQNLRAYIKELRHKYPNQSSSFWANIESSCKHSLIKQKDPSIVLIVNDVETQHLARTIITDVLNTLLKLVNKTSSGSRLDSFVIDPVDDSRLSQLIKEHSYDKSKLYIDTKLINLFTAGDRLALVNHVEALPAQTMLLFYTYGDDLQNAKFPGVLILMNLNIDTRLDETHRARFAKSSSSLTKYAEDYLFNLWSNSIDDDQLRPLFTRIANNVIFVNNE